VGSGVRTAVVIVLLAVTVCVFFGDVLFGNRVLLTCNTFLWQPWLRHANDEQLAERTYRTDSARTYLPRGVELKRRVKAGELPLWNPYPFGGSPFFADPQAKVVYPVSLMLTVFDPARALGYDVAIHFLLAMLGMYLFLRIIGASTLGCMAGAFAYGFSSFFFLRMGHPTFVAASQLFLYGVAALVVYVICDSIEALISREARVALGKVRILVVSAFLSGLVVAIQLVPFAEFLRNTQGQGLSLDSMRQAHLWHPVFLIRAIVPDFFGNPIDGTSWTGVVRGMVHPYNSGLMIYCGVTALLVALSGMVFIRVSRHIRALTVLLLLSVGMGTSVFLFKIASVLLPLATYSQMDRVSVVACFALAALAGKGLSMVSLSTDRRQRRYFVITALVIVAGLLVGSAVFVAKGPDLISGFSRKASELLAEKWFHQSGFKLREWLGSGTDRWLGFQHRQIARALVFGIVGLVSLILSVRFRPKARIAFGAGVILVLTILVDVGLTARRYYVSQPGESLTPTQGIEELKGLLDEPGRWRTGNLEAQGSALPSNIPQIYGIPMFGGTNAVLPAAYADRLRLVMSSGDIEPAMGPATGTVGDLMCVRYLVAADSLAAPSNDLARTGYRLVHGGDMYVYENTSALPKGICVDRDLVGPGFFRRPPGGGPPILNLMAGLDRIESLICGRCEIVRYEPERVELEVKAEKDCFLLFQDTYYPGWVADVDGMRQPILKTDLGFRAVQLPAGDHSVVMKFRPMSFKLGLGLTCLGIILSIVYGTKKGFRQKSRKQG